MSSEQKAQLQSHFGARAQAYVASKSHAGGSDLDRLLQWTAARTSGEVLDLATGGGHTALALARAVHRVVAADHPRPGLARE